MHAQTDAALKAAAREVVTTTALNNLPAAFARNRVIDAQSSAAFWGVSLPHWRRLYRTGKVPRPFKVGDRKLGWRIGDLVDALAERAVEVA